MLNKNLAEDLIKRAKLIRDEADHVIGTEADDFKEVAEKDFKRMKELITEALIRINREK